MKAGLVLNGYSPHWPRQVRELSCFAEKYIDGVPGAVILWGNISPSIFGLSADRIDLVNVGYLYESDNALAVLPELCQGYDILIFPSDFFGQELSVRLGITLGGSSLSGVLRIEVKEDMFLVEKRVYAQHLTAVFEMSKSPYCLSLAQGSESPPASINQVKPLIVNHDYKDVSVPDYVVESSLAPLEVKEDLQDAKRLIVGGQGLAGPEGVSAAHKLAQSLGFDFGVSRPVVMNAWAAMNRLVGISGVITKPDVVLTLGVSGAAALYAGLEKSRQIFSVNRDPKAAIMKRSDLAIIDDCLSIISELQKLVDAESSGDKG